MAVTSSQGVFSGLDTNQIISQLLELERRPLQQLTVRKASYEAKISAYGSLSSSLSKLKSALSSLKSSTIFSMSASSSDTAVFTATATSASEGSYQVKVNNIATKQSIYSSLFTAETAEVADLSTVAAQKLRIQVGSGTAVEITIDSTNNTLKGIKDAINKANAGVTASVINDGTGYRLTITSNSTGASNRMTIKVDEDNDGTYEEATAETDTTALSRLAFNATYDASGNVTGGTTNMTQSQAAVDASMVVDGLTITRSSNTVADLITGVTLTLLKDSAGKTLNLTVSKDLEKMKSNINNFVAAYNASVTIAQGLAESKDGKSALLLGDNTTRGILTSLRSTITTAYAGKLPAAFGLSHDRNGLLSLNATIFDGAAKSDLPGMVGTFDVMAKALEGIVTGQTGTLLPARTDGLRESVDQTQVSIDRYQMRLEKIELAYRRKFTTLERTLSQIQQGSSVLTERLNALSSLD